MNAKSVSAIMEGLVKDGVADSAPVKQDKNIATEVGPWFIKRQFELLVAFGDGTIQVAPGSAIGMSWTGSNDGILIQSPEHTKTVFEIGSIVGARW